MLARVLSPLIDHDLSEEVLDDTFWSTYTNIHAMIMTKKMGLHTKQEVDKALLEGMLRALADASTDYTQFLENFLGLMVVSQTS